LTQHHHDLILRPITGPDELDLFTRFPYVLNPELAHAAGTRILAAQDVPRIRASTDVGNVPMARAFERAGYVNFERQIDMTWP
jgi:hypothetical protein